MKHQLQTHAEAVRLALDSPPEHAAQVGFQYRQAAARRIQLDQRLRTLAAEQASTRDELLKAHGAESALHDAFCSLVGLTAPTAEKPHG